MNYTRESSSFRDPDGFVFYAEGEVYRAVRPAYYPTLDALFTSGLLKKLTEDKKLTAFENIDPPPVQIAEPCKVLKAERIPFIAHPCELTFTALRKAALLTLILQEQALLNGFSLKDASVFNVQFRGPRAVYIDLLSFERYEEGTPWVAYGQFIRHFLGPLMLMHYGIPFVNRFFRAHLDGIPVSLTSALLPARSRLSLAALTHIHTHARLEKNSSAPQKKNTGSLKLSKKRQLQIIAHLRETVRNLRQPKQKGVWTDYYDTCNYSDEGTQSKKDFVTAAATEIKPRLCLDLGANTGEYSEAVAPHCRYVLASDADWSVLSVIEKRKLENVQAIYQDISDPTPASGWECKERADFFARTAGADLVLALALIHHLCVANNTSLEMAANMFARWRGHLIIEFVPASDPQAQRLLSARKDIFDSYNKENFLRAFAKRFTVLRQCEVPDSQRVLYFMKRKENEEGQA